MSSSNEDILKPTARIGDRGDCDLPENRINVQNDWLLRSAIHAESNYPQYPQQFGAGSKLNSIDLAYLKDLDLSSTTESPSTLAATNREVESSTSFEYQENNLIRSPFQREIQRLLDSSASKVTITANRASIDAQNYNATKLNAQHMNNDVNGSSSHSKQSNIELEAAQVLLIGGNSAITNGKHPVGLDAIKEIAKNTANSDSSQM